MTVGRKLFKNVAGLSVGSILVRAFSFATMPLLTRMLSPDAYGVAAILGTLAMFLSAPSLAGLDMTCMRS